MIVLTTFPSPTELVRHKERDTVVNIDGTSHGNGTLFITETIVAWQNVDGQGFCLDYPKISLHAISRDTSAFPEQCLFLMIEGKLAEEVDTAERQGSDDEEEEDKDQIITEVRFIPSNKLSLEPMFRAMSGCQVLHPDEQDTDSEAEEEEAAEYFQGEEGIDHLTAQGQLTLQHLDSLLISGQGDGPANGVVTNGSSVPSEQFEDAEDQMDQ